MNDILLSAPSILVGLFIYQLLVVPFGGFSGWAGSIALAILVIPVIVRTTEDMLNLVPVGLREAAFALGAPQWKVVMMVTWRAARAGIVTGVLLAIARAAGETAPLLFTSLGNNSWSVDLSKPMASLPIAIYQYAGSPSTTGWPWPGPARCSSRWACWCSMWCRGSSWRGRTDRAGFPTQFRPLRRARDPNEARP